MKRKAASSGTAVLYNAKPQPEMVGHQQAESTGDNSIWTALAEFHAASQTIPRCVPISSTATCGTVKGASSAKHRLGPDSQPLCDWIHSTLLRPGGVSCTRSIRAYLRRYLPGFGGVLSVVLGALAAYTISAAIYLAIVKSTDSVSADLVEAAFADTECTQCIRAFPIWSHRRCGPAPIRFGVGLQTRTGPLTCPTMR